MQRINETRIWFFNKVNKIDKTLAKLTKDKEKIMEICKIRGKGEVIKTDTRKTQRIIRMCFIPKSGKLKQMDKFLGICNLRKLNIN